MNCFGFFFLDGGGLTNLYFFHSLFNSCHDAVPYKDYYEACKHDVFTKGKPSVCASLEAYAQLCGENSICVDWRNSSILNGLCGTLTNALTILVILMFIMCGYI